MEYMIDGFRCSSSITFLSTGETVPFEPEKHARAVIKSVVEKMTVEQIEKLPIAEGEPTLVLEISSDGKKRWL